MSHTENQGFTTGVQEESIDLKGGPDAGRSRISASRRSARSPSLHRWIRIYPPRTVSRRQGSQQAMIPIRDAVLGLLCMPVDYVYP